MRFRHRPRGSQRQLSHARPPVDRNQPGRANLVAAGDTAGCGHGCRRIADGNPAGFPAVDAIPRRGCPRQLSGESRGVFRTLERHGRGRLGRDRVCRPRLAGRRIGNRNHATPPRRVHRKRTAASAGQKRVATGPADRLGDGRSGGRSRIASAGSPARAGVSTGKPVADAPGRSAGRRVSDRRGRRPGDSGPSENSCARVLPGRLWRAD